MSDQGNQEIALDHLTSDSDGVKDFKIKLEKLDLNNEFLQSCKSDDLVQLNVQADILNDQITDETLKSIKNEESNLNETVNESNLNNETSNIDQNELKEQADVKEEEDMGPIEYCEGL